MITIYFIVCILWIGFGFYQIIFYDFSPEKKSLVGITCIIQGSMASYIIYDRFYKKKKKFPSEK
jgi:hypothetical protein